MNKIISFKFSGFSGDVIHYLAGIKHVCESLEAKAEIYLWLNRGGALYEGAQHPYGGMMINRYAFDMLRPLLLRQSYVDKVEPWEGQEIIVDMDKIRQAQLNMPYGNLSHWIGMKFSDMQADLTEKWLQTDPLSEFSDKVFPHETILINRTSRYQNPYISYFFLKDYKDDLMFVGMEEEYKQFQDEWKFELPLLKVRDFHELAACIRNCKFFIGNQSMCFAIAEALKVPRILEICPFAPNVHPVGQRAHYFQFQEGLMFLVDKLNKEL